MVFYICDRKKCERCSSECLHTSDYKHAANKTVIPKDLSISFKMDQFGSLWEKEPKNTLNNFSRYDEGQEEIKRWHK